MSIGECIKIHYDYDNVPGAFVDTIEKYNWNESKNLSS